MAEYEIRISGVHYGANGDDDMTLAELMTTIQQKSDNISMAVKKLQSLMATIKE